ncbi:MAG TPA: hypothetical protein VMY99_04395 [Nevskiaceae bacterium]|nr:hypothetical protein [Nevskiaceae bacterium]
MNSEKDPLSWRIQGGVLAAAAFLAPSEIMGTAVGLTTGDITRGAEVTGFSLSVAMILGATVVYDWLREKPAAGFLFPAPPAAQGPEYNRPD